MREAETEILLPSPLAAVVTRLALLAPLALAGCSTSSLNVHSVPEGAGVYVSILGRGTPKLVGQTPLEMTSRQIRDQTGGGGPFFVELKKDGFQASRTLVTELPSEDLELAITLQRDLTLEQADAFNDAVDVLFESQRLARVGRLVEAVSLLKSVERSRPELSAPFELEGGILYLMRRFKSSLDAYATAAKLNPKSLAAARMRDLLEKRLGFNAIGGSTASSAPSSAEGKASAPTSPGEPAIDRDPAEAASDVGAAPIPDPGPAPALGPASGGPQ